VPHQAHNPNNYGRALLSAPPQAIAPNLHKNVLNVYIQLANKMGFKNIYNGTIKKIMAFGVSLKADVFEILI
jgi:hypothetical protein